MAESTLSLTRDQLRSEVGLMLGYGLSSSDWEPEQLQRIDLCIRDGLGQFYYPMTGDQKSIHEWSFLTPTATLSLTVAGGYDYDLPDDCDGIVERFIVTTGSSAATVIPIVEVDVLLQLKAGEGASAALPRVAALRPKDTGPTTSASQRWEVLFYPTPDGNYTVSYDYPVQVDSIISTSNSYLPGGASHAQTILAACLSVAERFFMPGDQSRQQAFQERLQASIEYDNRNQKTRANQTWAITEPVYGTWSWFRREVSGYLLKEWNIALLTHAQLAQVESLVQRGLRTFYNPPGIPRGWSFLNIIGTITMVEATAAYDLPAGFGELVGSMTLSAAAASHQPLRLVTETELRASQISEATSGIPEYVTIRSKTTDGSAAHLREAVVFPTPDASAAALSPATITYRYKVSPAAMTASVLYPYGSNVHAEAMRQAMVAHAAEQKDGVDPASEWQKFQQLLSASLMADINVEVQIPSQERMAPQPQEK